MWSELPYEIRRLVWIASMQVDRYQRETSAVVLQSIWRGREHRTSATGFDFYKHWRRHYWKKFVASTGGHHRQLAGLASYPENQWARQISLSMEEWARRT